MDVINKQSIVKLDNHWYNNAIRLNKNASEPLVV